MKCCAVNNIPRKITNILEVMRLACARKPQKKAAWAEQKCADSKAPGETQRPVIIRLSCEGNQEQ